MAAALCGLRKLRHKSRAGAVPVNPTEDRTQGYLNDLNSVFLHNTDYLTKGDKKGLFSLAKTERIGSLPGDAVAASKHLGAKHSGGRKKKALFKSKGNAGM